MLFSYSAGKQARKRKCNLQQKYGEVIWSALQEGDQRGSIRVLCGILKHNSPWGGCMINPARKVREQQRKEKAAFDGNSWMLTL